MTASAIGRRVISSVARTSTPPDTAEPADAQEPVVDDDRQNALQAIVGAIPAEGIGTYIAIYTLVITTFTATQFDAPELAWVLPTATFGAVVVSAGVNILALLWPTRGTWKGLTRPKRITAGWSLFWRGWAVSALFLIYVIATPDNPFAHYLGVPLNAGLILAIVAAAIIGIVKKP